MNGLLNSLAEDELQLIRETERSRISGLDEDALVALHTRVRRARDKYVKLYRREASARVATLGGRGAARPKNQRNAQKAEVFEDALSRVSRQLATAARHSATELRAERLAAARRERAAVPAPKSAAARRRPATKATKAKATARAAAARTDRRPALPARRKRQASTLAAGARRQTRRDIR